MQHLLQMLTLRKAAGCPFSVTLVMTLVYCFQVISPARRLRVLKPRLQQLQAQVQS